MTRTRATRFTLVIVSLAFAASGAQAQLGATVPNWPVPSSSSGSSSRGIRALADVTNPLPFIGVTPCRIVDTRGPAGTFGGPSLPASTPRNFPLPTGPCVGIPASVSAYSLNITVTNTLGPGFISIYPQGGAAPLVSTLNYLAGQTLANAAIVPAGSGGGITVIAGVSGTDLIIDINGYYASTPGDQQNFFQVYNNSSLYSINTTNSSTTCTGICGIHAAAFSGHAIGGQALGTFGTNHGVTGSTASTGGGSAGVFGVDGTGEPGGTFLAFTFASAGVRGDSRSGFAVQGLSEFAAVQGSLLNSSGTFLAQGYLSTTFGTGAGGATGPWGVFASGDLGASGAKHFVEPHPADASKVIVYSSIEGRTVDTYFRGSGQTINRQAVIEVPEDFRIVTDEEGVTVQLTPVGALATMAVMSQDLNRVVVKSSTDVQFHYLIQGLRRAFKNFQPVGKGSEFMPRTPSDRMPGYLTEEAQRRLISNGTYNEDGTVNMTTAERLGWVKAWADREAQTQAAAREARKAASAIQR